MSELAHASDDLVIPPYEPFRLPPSERDEATALLRDGLVRPLVADVLVATAAPDDAWVRARGVLQLLPATGRSWTASFRTAAWVFTGFWPEPGAPAFAEVIVLPGQRRPGGSPLRGRQVALEAGESMDLHGLRVTTPVRTAADVARDLPAAQALPVLQALGAQCGVRPPQVLRHLSRMRYARGTARARPVVRAWAEL